MTSGSWNVLVGPEGLAGGVEMIEVVAMEGTFSISMFILMVGLEGLPLSIMADLKLCLFLMKFGLRGGARELGMFLLLELGEPLFLLLITDGTVRGADILQDLVFS